MSGRAYTFGSLIDPACTVRRIRSSNRTSLGPSKRIPPPTGAHAVAKEASLKQDRSTSGGRPLEGEHLDTSTAADARHWISIYSDLISFKLGLLARIRRDIQKLNPIAQLSAATDLVLIEQQRDGYHGRIRLWYQRLWDLQGLWLDSDTRMVRHGEKYLTLTRREFQLLSFLLAHPNRFFTSTQIVGQAWADRALSPEEVRNYVLRLRKALVELEIPCDLVNRPGRGYSLIFRPEEEAR